VSALSINILAQIRRNLVAIVSLALSMASLGYNTWRNETSEAHRNIRQAAFRTLETLGELQVVVDARRYQGDRMRGDYVAGWGRITLISDLGSLLPAPVPQSAENLHQVWQENFDQWYSADDPQAEQKISQAIGLTREQVLATLKSLK
jgi:hypothetical protein